MNELDGLKQQLETLTKRLKQTQSDHQKNLSVERAKLKVEQSERERNMKAQVANFERQCKQHRNSRKRAEELLSQMEYDLHNRVVKLEEENKALRDRDLSRVEIGDDVGETADGHQCRKEVTASKIASLERENVSLKGEVASLQGEMVSSEGHQCRAEVTASKIASLERENASLQGEVASLQGEMVSSEGHQCQAEVTASKIASLERENASLQGEVASLQREMVSSEDHQCREEVTASKIASLEKENASLHGEVASLHQNISFLSVREVDTQKDLSMIREKYDTMSNHCADMEVHLMNQGDSNDLAFIETRRVDYDAEMRRTFDFMSEAERIACDLKGAVDMLDINVKATSLVSIIEIVKQVSKSLIQTFDEFGSADDERWKS